MNGRAQAGGVPPGPGRAGLRTAAAASSSVLRHAVWWIEWHTRTHPGGPCRDLEQMELSAELRTTTSSSP